MFYWLELSVKGIGLPVRSTVVEVGIVGTDGMECALWEIGMYFLFVVGCEETLSRGLWTCLSQLCGSSVSNLDNKTSLSPWGSNQLRRPGGNRQASFPKIRMVVSFCLVIAGTPSQWIAVLEFKYSSDPAQCEIKMTAITNHSILPWQAGRSSFLKVCPAQLWLVFTFHMGILIRRHCVFHCNFVGIWQGVLLLV